MNCNVHVTPPGKRICVLLYCIRRETLVKRKAKLLFRPVNKDPVKMLTQKDMKVISTNLNISAIYDGVL